MRIALLALLLTVSQPAHAERVLVFAPMRTSFRSATLFRPFRFGTLKNKDAVAASRVLRLIFPP